jgi:hypothetical protein
MISIVLLKIWYKNGIKKFSAIWRQNHHAKNATENERHCSDFTFSEQDIISWSLPRWGCMPRRGK